MKKDAEKFGGMKKKHYLCTRLLRTKLLSNKESSQIKSFWVVTRVAKWGRL
ncbi:hypothetical protein [Prevotella sp. AM34-19LB]|uniref:hypothetical protein n=1 Tax=Prevotella sp. AM34-19LB TaxID=2292364 RepID=UPI001F468AAB|nr:hypothetical protein [Prevotella sp. AM34-19LB]